jgi:hypothetical protein
MKNESVRGYSWQVYSSGGQYRVELWRDPFDGACLATTRWVGSRSAALRDARRVFKLGAPKPRAKVKR